MRSLQVLLLLCMLLAVAVGQLPGTVAKKTTRDSATTLGKLRLMMLKWFCSDEKGNLKERPCINYTFMTRLRSAKDAATRKAIIAERMRSLPPGDEERKESAQQSRSGYMKMYHTYCAQPAPEHPEVCSNLTLKKAYAMFQGKGPKAPG